MKFKKKRLLALPTISLRGMKPGDSRYFKAQDGLKVTPKTGKHGEPVLDPETGEPQEITTLHVIDMETGEEGEIVLGFIVRQALEKLDSVKGFTFGITKGATKNRTTEWQVYEVEVSK